MTWIPGQVTLSTTAALVKEEDSRRSTLQVVNTDTAITVYLGPNNRVSSSNGFRLIAGASYKFTLAAGDEVYAVAASGTPVLDVLEERAR